MKNITLSIPESLVRQARSYAAKHGTSLNALIRQLLKSTVETDQKRKADQILKEMEKLKSAQTSVNWKREDLYDR